MTNFKFIMNPLRILKCLPLLFVLWIFLPLPSHAQSARTQWFEDARFGMFIHWGLYSAAEGMWQGEKLRYLNQYAEWIRYRNRIPKKDYGKLAKRFVWNEIDPEKWVKLAKDAGMKYIIITAKHHDGVAIWDTKVGRYSLPALSGSHRDIIKEIADACHKYGMKLGFYYSHWIDWAAPNGWNQNQELTGQLSDTEFDQYWQHKVIPQLRELLTHYGKISIMWFDMWIPYQKTIIKKKQLIQAAELIRKLQPGCLINSRLGLPPGSKYVDYETLGDNQFGAVYTSHPWATPGTIAHSWGYNGQDKDFKSTSELLKSLISNVSLNGGYTLNIGPRANGEVPYESVSRLKEIGKWLKAYGESIYGCTGLGLRADQFDWGRITFNKHNKNIYLHVFNWPLDSTLRITGLLQTPKRIELLRRNKTPLALTFDQKGPFIHIHLPAQQPDSYVSVIRITANENTKLDKEVVAESTFGGFALRSTNLRNKEEYPIVKYDGTRPTYTKMGGQILSWKVYLPEKGRYAIDLSAHNPNKDTVQVEIKMGQHVLNGLIAPDGQVVVEPYQHNYTDEFVDHHWGILNINQAGEKTVTCKVKDGQKLWFNTIWIEKAE